VIFFGFKSNDFFRFARRVYYVLGCVDVSSLKRGRHSGGICS
jgi:hypothetical protein